VHLVWEHQHSAWTKNRFYDVAISPLNIEKAVSISEAVYGAVGSFHEITELKNVEKLRDDFVANASHELKTPLTSIVGYTNAMESTIAAGDLKKAGELLSVVKRNVTRLDKLIKDLLDLSQVEATVIENKDPINISEICEGVVQDLKNLYSQKNQLVEYQTGVEIIYGNKVMIEQIIFNLTHNAIKYCPPLAKINIHWSNAGKEIILRVSDNGPGIGKEHLGRLFERFYRVDKSRSSDVAGTGLGLAIVKHAVQKHGGTISASSFLGEGTTFECRFPI
jgi:two-component system, OmpR family, phosphate regulon sensor histidine kinase PhoR